MPENSVKKIVPIISFETGGLSRDELEAIFESMPVDITFADRNDIVTYYNHPNKRIFPRAQSDIGRKAQQCFLQAEGDFLERIEKVNKIVSDLKAGKTPAIELCVNRNGHLIHIRYLPVRDNAKSYAGCIEVVQDITDIKKIDAEKKA